jgi:hypothetical protein
MPKLSRVGSEFELSVMRRSRLTPTVGAANDDESVSFAVLLGFRISPRSPPRAPVGFPLTRPTNAMGVDDELASESVHPEIFVSGVSAARPVKSVTAADKVPSGAIMNREYLSSFIIKSFYV